MTRPQASSEPAPAVIAQMAERRERILQAARDIVAEQGVDRLTMRALAARSRVTVPTLYNLVGGRDRVIREAVRERTARFVAGIVAPTLGDPAARVLAVAEACTSELLGTPHYYRPLLVWIFSTEAADDVQAEVGAALSRELHAALKALRAAGGLAEWAEPAALAASMARHLGAASVAWARGEIDDDRFQARGLYDVAVSLRAGVTQAGSATRLERILVRAQERLHAADDRAQGLHTDLKLGGRS